VFLRISQHIAITDTPVCFLTRDIFVSVMYTTSLCYSEEPAQCGPQSNITLSISTLLTSQDILLQTTLNGQCQDPKDSHFLPPWNPSSVYHYPLHFVKNRELLKAFSPSLD